MLQFGRFKSRRSEAVYEQVLELLPNIYITFGKGVQTFEMI